MNRTTSPGKFVTMIAVMIGMVGLSHAASAAIDPMRIAYDRVSGVSHVVLTDASGQVVADASWPGELPLANAARTDFFLPAALLGHLRDQIVVSGDRSGSTGLGAILKTMGPLAATPTSSILANRITRLLGSVGAAEWCGNKMVNGDCTGTCISNEGVITCAGCACKGSTAGLW